MKTTPTQQLKKDHDAILLLLKILGSISQKLESGTQVKPEHLEKILEFIKVFSDQCHHHKEEKLLFPRLEAAGIPRFGGPIGVMLEEHSIGRDYVKQFAKGVAQYKVGKKGAATIIVENVRNYITLLEPHIDKENHILYPLADSCIPPEKQQALLKGFEKIEQEKIGHGKHEKFHRLLHQLQKIYPNE